MLQENQSMLHQELLQSVKPDESLCEKILNMGFDIEMIREALKSTSNDMQKAIENLLKMQADGTYQDVLKNVLQHVTSSGNETNTPSTSAAAIATAVAHSVQDLENEREVCLILSRKL